MTFEEAAAQASVNSFLAFCSPLTDRLSARGMGTMDGHMLLSRDFPCQQAVQSPCSRQRGIKRIEKK